MTSAEGDPLRDLIRAKLAADPDRVVLDVEEPRKPKPDPGPLYGDPLGDLLRAKLDAGRSIRLKGL